MSLVYLYCAVSAILICHTMLFSLSMCNLSKFFKDCTASLYYIALCYSFLRIECTALYICCTCYGFLGLSSKISLFCQQSYFSVQIVSLILVLFIFTFRTSSEFFVTCYFYYSVQLYSWGFQLVSACQNVPDITMIIII